MRHAGSVVQTTIMDFLSQKKQPSNRIGFTLHESFVSTLDVQADPHVAFLCHLRIKVIH